MLLQKKVLSIAILKHIASKNADYGEAQRYLLFQYNEDTMKPILDENGRLIPREEYYLDGINCDPFTFDMECKELNAQYRKNQTFDEVKSHHYYNIFMGNPLTSSKDLSISLLKLLECRMQWYIDFITWTSRPYFRLITGSSFTVFVLCRLDHIRCIRVTHSSLNR